jgi:hypothetical protein
MNEQSLPIDALVYRMAEGAADLLHRSESPETSRLLADLIPDDWNRGARDHPYHETIDPVYLVT